MISSKWPGTIWKFICYIFMKIKTIITGSTGMIGKGVLLECLDDPNVESVLVINRQTTDIKHEKLWEIIHKDLFDLKPFESQFKGYNACFFCLGISSVGVKEKEYDHITYDLTLDFAKTVLKMNPGITFCYISGAGTDSSEKGKSMWARVKGKTENALLALPFKRAYMFRPGYIQPVKGIRSKTKNYNIFYSVMKPFYPLLKTIPKYVTSTEKLGKAMISVTMNGFDRNILESLDINVAARGNG
jgi:uncharacterized protein YbjT (DUF2867 family)